MLQALELLPDEPGPETGTADPPGDAIGLVRIYPKVVGVTGFVHGPGNSELQRLEHVPRSFYRNRGICP